jgi:hypothetical protein
MEKAKRNNHEMKEVQSFKDLRSKMVTMEVLKKKTQKQSQIQEDFIS